MANSVELCFACLTATQFGRRCLTNWANPLPPPFRRPERLSSSIHLYIVKEGFLANQKNGFINGLDAAGKMWYDKGDDVWRDGIQEVKEMEEQDKR